MTAFPQPTNSLAGLVLCGGQSSRMGSDKGLLLQNQKTWAGLMVEKINALLLPVFISVQPAQKSIYSSIFPAEQLIFDNFSLHGPLAGLLTAHLCFPQTDWLVCACDLPDMTIAILRQLLDSYTSIPDYQCFVFKSQSGWEPLCGIYKSDALSRITDLHAHNQLPRHSMKAVLEICRTYTLDIVDESTLMSFKNYNLPTDIK